MHANAEIMLHSCRVDHVQSSHGQIQAKESTLTKVHANEEIKLENVSAHNVESTHGSLYWNNDENWLEATSSENLLTESSAEANKKIAIRGLRLSKVKSFYGEIIAKNCHLSQVFASKTSEFSNCTVDSIEIKAGGLILNNETLRKNRYGDLKARGEISLTKIRAKSVTSEEAKVRIQNCRVKKIQANREVFLLNSKIDEMILFVDETYAGVIHLEDATIKGNVIIRPLHPLKTNERVDANRNTFRNNTLYEIDGNTFNFEDHDPDNLKINLEMHKIILNPFMKGKINGDEYMFVAGNFLLLSSASLPQAGSQSPPKKIKVRMTGTGMIHGDLIFENCLANTEKDQGIQFKGSIRHSIVSSSKS